MFGAPFNIGSIVLNGFNYFNLVPLCQLPSILFLFTNDLSLAILRVTYFLRRKEKIDLSGLNVFFAFFLEAL